MANPADLPNASDFQNKLQSMSTMELPDQNPPKQVQDLEGVLRAHKTWVDSVAVPSAPLSGRRACLRGVDLRGANLSRRDLRGADLSRANLEGCVLAGAQLLLANLSGANLKGADLRGAQLRLADLTGTCLDGADLTGATLE